MRFYIPDTVIFNNEKPIIWYFSLSGIIKTKKKCNLTIKNIKETFIRKKSKSGLIATYIHTSNTNTDKIYFEHLNEKEFGNIFM